MRDLVLLLVTAINTLVSIGLGWCIISIEGANVLCIEVIVMVIVILCLLGITCLMWVIRSRESVEDEDVLDRI